MAAPPNIGLTNPAPTSQAAAAPPAGFGDQEWNIPTTTTKDWGADEEEWGNTEPVSGGIIKCSSVWHNLYNLSCFRLLVATGREGSYDAEL